MLPLVVACKMGSPPEVVNALLAAGAKPKPAMHAACNPQSDLDGKSCERLELIVHATKTRALRARRRIERRSSNRRSQMRSIK